MFSAKYKLNGFYSWQIINADGSVASKSQDKNNLILNQGLDYPSVYYFADCFASCCVGYGTTAPLLGDTSLQSEVKRTSTYHSESNGCRSYISGNTFNIQRSFNFSTETETVQYGEIGWSPLNEAGANLFSKSLMIDELGNVGLITISRNQYLRVIYTLQISFDPSSAVAYTPTIAGWDGNGVAQSQLIGIMGVTSSGTVAFFDSGRSVNEPKNSVLDIFVSTGLQTISGFGTTGNYSLGSWPQRATTYPYESGAYTKIYSANFSRASGTGYINSIGVGTSGFASTYSTFIHRLNSPQYKATDYELSLFFNYVWGRA